MLRSEDFDYPLPDERIARYPVSPRHDSKLLVYRGGQITDNHFLQLPDQLPEQTLLVFNNTRVIPARIAFHTETGARIEIFLLNPANKTAAVQDEVSRTGEATWEVMIGNRKRWKPGQTLSQTFTLNDTAVTLSASLVAEGPFTVSLTWTPEHLSFESIIEHIGHTPLPPYLKRESEEIDKDTYQTTYSKTKGSVAAPTAGLHFTPEVQALLSQKGIGQLEVTLHVGAGTFRPLKTEDAREHDMHAEQFQLTTGMMEQLLAHNGPVISVGTTSTRLLESLYWLAVQWMNDSHAAAYVDQHSPYRTYAVMPATRQEAISVVLDRMRQQQQDLIIGQTSIYIYPGYRFRMIDGLVTNFHQPKSTLLLLISTLIGDNWRTVYDHALNNGYRFLSYGDSSLLMP
jgi:S-adenosylmethionine:tRNA ribosyltransferase-isomerase